jgi:AhpD family alkylhydroperoxidase
MRGLESYVRASGLQPALLDLVRVRASQINGCAYCLDMHTQDARAAGETEQRLHVLSAWHEAPFYSQRERAALAWTEAVTLVGETHVPDDVYELARADFSDEELVNLTMAIVAINGWNRLEVSFRGVAGLYRPSPR